MIALSDDYRIDTDGRRNWILQKRHVAGPDAKDPGAVRWKNEGYYALLDQAMESWCERELKAYVSRRKRRTEDILQRLSELTETVK